MVRSIRKITLLVLLSLTISSSPAHSMSYASSIWNGATSLPTMLRESSIATRLSSLCVGGWNSTKNLVPSVAGVGSMLEKIPGVQSVVNNASQLLSGTSLFGGASRIASEYYKMESLAPGSINPLIAFAPVALYTLRSPMCSLLSKLTLNKFSPSFFNKLLTITTTPITLAMHAYCLYNLTLLAPFSVAMAYGNITLLLHEIKALCNINSLQVPMQRTNQIEPFLGPLLLALESRYERAAEDPVFKLINFILTFVITLRHYHGMGISTSIDGTLSDIKTSINKVKKQIQRRFSPPMRHDLAINTLGDHTDCGICLENYSPNETGIRLACNHHYHTDCIDPWLDTNPTCPTCRARADENNITHVTFK